MGKWALKAVEAKHGVRYYFRTHCPSTPRPQEATSKPRWLRSRKMAPPPALFGANPLLAAFHAGMMTWQVQTARFTIHAFFLHISGLENPFRCREVVSS